MTATDPNAEGGVTLHYRLRPSRRARRLRLTVSCDGSVVVTVPFGFGLSQVERFVREHVGWIGRQLTRLSRYRDHVFLPHDRRAYLSGKEDARRLIQATLERFAPALGVTYGDLRIKDLRRNWGSCSKRGNLNFNWKLSLLPLPLVEYVVVHELCHRRVFNHSKEFWRLVAATLPDWQERRRDLRRYHA